MKIYAPFGQLYEPVDAGLLLSYKESRDGQILEEGITEAGSMASFTAAGTAYATWGEPMVPFFIFYSMFGFQRVGDLIWSFGDQKGRGFLIGATAGRTTLSGEGLQHCDGHSPLLASAYPRCRVYDPAYAYELGIIVRDGLDRMYGTRNEDCYYYVTVYNENYVQPPVPADSGIDDVSIDDAIVRGIHRVDGADPAADPRVQLFGSGTLLREVLRAAELLASEFGVASDVWSVSSYQQLRADGLDCERRKRLGEAAPAPFVSRALDGYRGPVVAVTDYVKAVPEQVARFVGRPFHVLGTDGYGFSDIRIALRRHFEVDAEHIVVAALRALADEGSIDAATVARALVKYEIAADAPDPVTR
jgi:pyruvate dehydrogenase E1 component